MFQHYVISHGSCKNSVAKITRIAICIRKNLNQTSAVACVQTLPLPYWKDEQLDELQADCSALEPDEPKDS